MIETNHYLIKGGRLTEFQKANIVRQLLAAAAPDDTTWVNILLVFSNRHMDEKLMLQGKGVSLMRAKKMGGYVLTWERSVHEWNIKEQ